MAENSRENEKDIMSAIMNDETRYREGDVVKAKVFDIKADQTIVLVLPNNREATMHKDHYTRDESLDLKKEIQKGDEIQVKIVKISNDENNSQIYVSRLPLINDEMYKDVEELVESKEIISTIVKNIKENGIILSYKGIEMFLPDRLLDNKYLQNKEELKNKKLDVVIIKFEKQGRRTSIICSRKPIFKKEKKEQQLLREQNKQKALDSIQTGDVLDVEVVKILKNSIEVSINEYLNGQVRISQIAHVHIDNIEDVIKLGDKVTVVVLEKQGRRIDLSIKAMLPTPFELFIEKNHVGDVVKAKVERKFEKGYIVSLSDNVTAFLSMYEIAWNPKNNFETMYNIGDEIDVKITKISEETGKISVSRKQLEENPWNSINLKENDKIEVKVIKQQENGSGLDVEYHAVFGFVPKSELLKKLTDYNKDDIITVRVLKVNPTIWDLVLSEKPEKTEIKKTKVKEEKEVVEEDEKATIGDIISKENL